MTEATYMHARTTVSQEVLTHLLLRLAHLHQAGRRSRAPECSLSRPNHTRVPMPPPRPATCAHILLSTQLDSLPGEAFLALLPLPSGL